jgi:polar amino acid transport system permease protein
MEFEWDLITRYGPALLFGLWMTIWMVALAVMIATVLGLVLSLALTSRTIFLRAPVRAYVEIMRGTPVLIILFVLYYGGPSIGLLLDAIPAGVIGLGVYGAAYFAEIFRSGLQSIPPGQIEAARMVGLTKSQVLFRIKFPQMLGLILPPLANQTIILIKESALLSIITVPELTKTTSQMVAETFAVVEPYVAAAFLYWVFVEIVSWFFRTLEKRVRHG